VGICNCGPRCPLQSQGNVTKLQSYRGLRCDEGGWLEKGKARHVAWQSQLQLWPFRIKTTTAQSQCNALSTNSQSPFNASKVFTCRAMPHLNNLHEIKKNAEPQVALVSQVALRKRLARSAAHTARGSAALRALRAHDAILLSLSRMKGGSRVGEAGAAQNIHKFSLSLPRRNTSLAIATQPATTKPTQPQHPARAQVSHCA
jgi:hypothetical protein